MAEELRNKRLKIFRVGRNGEVESVEEQMLIPADQKQPSPLAGPVPIGGGTQSTKFLGSPVVAGGAMQPGRGGKVVKPKAYDAKFANVPTKRGGGRRNA